MHTKIQITKIFQSYTEAKESIKNLSASNFLSKQLKRTNRGYTGHEYIEDTNLIHMNGKVYDPTIGRFLSPDPYIQSPFNSQNYNRYSYVMNNPLNLIDPSV